MAVLVSVCFGDAVASIDGRVYIVLAEFILWVISKMKCRGQEAKLQGGRKECNLIIR